MSITHPAGLSCSINRTIVVVTFLLSGCALVALVMLSLFRPHHYGNTESIIYGFSLFTCSLCSCLYTTRFFRVPVALLRQLDHAAIFLLVAGTYTPFAAGIAGPFGLRLLYWVWGVAFLGVGLRLTFRTGYDRLFIALYVLQGWLFLTAIPAVIHQVSPFSLLFLGLGAITYSLGALVFARDIGRWTDPVWHGCVLCAAGLHFVAVLDVVIRPMMV